MHTENPVLKARKTLGLTQSEFAGELGVNLSTVWRWENDKMKVGRLALKAVERLMDRQPEASSEAGRAA